MSRTLLDLATCCLIQIAAPTRTWIIDPLALSGLDPLAPVFASAAITKVIHHAQFERRVLAKLGLALDGVFDTLDASRARHGRDAAGGHSLAAVVRRELGLHVDKTQQTSNWAQRPLTDEQLRYAAADAEVLLGLRQALETEARLVDRTRDTENVQ
jgi:ATP-dependent Lhr-like helicase